MTRRLGILIGGTLLLWVVVVYPAHLAWGTAAIMQSATAMGLCLVPTVATLVWAGWAQGGSPARQLGFVLGGTGVRMAVVLAGGLALSLAVPGFCEPDQTAFWAWVLMFYLATLAIEVALLLGQFKQGGGMAMAK